MVKNKICLRYIGHQNREKLDNWGLEGNTDPIYFFLPPFLPPFLWREEGWEGGKEGLKGGVEKALPPYIPVYLPSF